MAERCLSLSWWWACESRRGRSRRGSGRCSGLSVVRGRLRGLSWGNRPHFGRISPGALSPGARCDWPTSTSPAWARRLRPGPAGRDRALDAMGRRLRSPRLPGVDVVSPASMSPGVDASMSPASMRWADVYVSGLGPREAPWLSLSWWWAHGPQRVGLALDAMGRRLPGVDVPGVDASMSPAS